jgi:hypothetical protein
MLQLQLMERKRELVLRADVDELLDTVAGVTLTALSGLAARCTSDLLVRRRIDSVVLEVRREIATICSRMADKRNEPPLSEQD